MLSVSAQPPIVLNSLSILGTHLPHIMFKRSKSYVHMNRHYAVEDDDNDIVCIFGIRISALITYP